MGFAIVTGASGGIGFELAKLCAEHGHDLLIAADEPAIAEAALQAIAYTAPAGLTAELRRRMAEGNTAD